MASDIAQRALERAQELRVKEPDETRPYQHKYEAADALQAAVAELQALAQPTSTEDSAVAALIATLQCRRGLVLLETDLTADGEACLKEALQFLESDAIGNLSLLLEAYNAMGALLCERGDFNTAIVWLQKAEALYQQRQPSAANPPGEPAVPPGPEGECSSSPLEYTPLDRIHTSTLFYLAQVHAHAGHKEPAALYCAATLGRQLASGELLLDDWVQNCLQLSGYFINVHAYALVEYCLRAVDALLALQQQKRQQRRQKALAAAAAAAAAAEGSEGAQASTAEARAVEANGSTSSADPSAAAASSGDAAAASAAGAAATGGTPAAGDNSASGDSSGDQRLLDDDVAANVQLAWAKMYLYRLQASHSVHVLRHPLEPPCAYPTPATFPPMLAFHQSSALQLPPIESLPWGDAALAASFEGARELFNAAMPRFKTALEYYKLDGWVTEHVRIVMEMSNLYRCLAGFEGDHRRRCAMHKARAKLLVPLSGGQLNAAHHLGLVRSVELELGNVHRQLSELHEDAADSAGGGGDRVQARAEGDKAAAHSQEAIKHYEAFLATFKSKDGKMPEGRIEDAANEGYFLTAAFSCSRLMLRKPSSSSKRDTALLQQAHTQLCWAIDYVECHKLGEFAQEAKLGKELAALLAENMRVNALAAAAAAAAR